MDFDKFRPELLKTHIARITRGSHMPGFPVDGHICIWPYYDKVLTLLLPSLWSFLEKHTRSLYHLAV